MTDGLGQSGEPTGAGPWRRALGRSVQAGTTATVLAAGACLVGGRWWPFELGTHFFPHLAALLLFAAAAGGLLSLRRGWILAPGGLAVVLLLVMTGRARTPVPGAGASGAGAAVSVDAPTLTALFVNVESTNTEHDRVVELIRRERPDVIGVAEATRRWFGALEALRDDYPFVVEDVRETNFGILLLSRFPLEGGIVALGPEPLPAVFARVDAPGGPVRMVVTHAPPPFLPRRLKSRTAHLQELAERVAASSGPTVVLGDFNLTRWSPYYPDWVRASGLRQALTGLRALYTWPASVPPLALGIDHCFVSADVTGVSAAVLPAVGSDHFPVRCTVRYPERPVD